MTETVNENNASPDSYVVIRIKVPTIKTLVGKVTSKKTSLGKRVGSMFNNVIGKKSSMDETETEADESELAERRKKIMVDTNGNQNLNDGMAEKERTFRSPRRTAESEEISKRIDKLLERMNVHDDAGSKGVLFETATRCVTFRSFRSMKTTMEDEKQIELCKKKILMGMRCRPLGDDENGLLIP